MKYQVSVGETTIDVEISRDRIIADGRRVHAYLESVPSSPMSRLFVDGTPFEVAVECREGAWTVYLDGRQWEATVVDAGASERGKDPAKAGSSAVAGVVRAPMPGMVVRWEVEEGQTVNQGDGLVVLEAMKMENDIRAKGRGVVRRILIESGKAVEKGTALLEMGPAS